MMKLEQLKEITDETEQISKTYEIFNENIRLNRSKAARIEFLTTVKFIEKYLQPGGKILDIGAGTGEYSFYFAEKGHSVSAIELSDNNAKIFRQKMTENTNIDFRQGNAIDLSCYESNSFDIVLLMGPLYHLHKEEDRQKCIAEAKRVCREEGTLFFAFIANDMVILNEFYHYPNYFNENTYDHDTFKVEDFPFVFFTVSQCRRMLLDGGIHIIHEIASDGVSEMLEEKINAMDDSSYEQYLKYHFYCCEKPEMLGHSNHLLFVGTK